MTTAKKILFLLFLSALFLVSAAQASAADPASIVGEGRHFVFSDSGFMKKLFGARHSFEGGFTTDLTRGELWALDKVFEVEVAPIPLWRIQNETEEVQPQEVAVAETSTTEEGAALVIKRSTPFEKIGWGLRAIYQDEELEVTNGGEGLRVAILDTGADRDHPDLAGAVVDCVDFTRSSIFTEACEDKNGHGTHLAGIVAAGSGESGEGIWGAAPQTSLSAYKVCLSEGLCWADDVAVAIRYAADQGINIINIGFSGPEKSDLVKSAIEHAYNNNVLVIGPAGSGEGDSIPVGYPAADKNVVAVGAVSESLEIPDWSPIGTNDGDFLIEENEVEFAAPGVDIESIWPEREYITLSGTSQSSAFVSGLAAKIWDGSATSTRALLQSLAIDLGPEGDDPQTGFGMPVVPTEPEETAISTGDGTEESLPAEENVTDTLPETTQ